MITADLSQYPLGEETRKYLDSVAFGHVIDGELVQSASGETLPIYEPSTGNEIGRVAAGGAEELERAVGAARRSFEDGRWRNLAPLEKEKRLRRLTELFADRAPVFSDLDTLDAGLLKGYTEAIGQFAIAGLEYYSGWPSKISGTIPAVVAATSPCTSHREPLGVVGVIVPWNGPAFVINFVVAALACGNSVILKPAEQTPMSATLMGQLCQEAGIPPGVVNVLHGTGEVIGAGLVAHPGVDAISFTGSVDTGKRIQAAGAATLKRVALELGGKSAHIFFDDCDLEPAAATAAAAVWGASGQVCTAGTRVLVQRGIYEDFITQVKANTESLVIGSPGSTRPASSDRSCRRTSSTASPATSASARTRAPRCSSAASATASTATSSSRRSSPACPTRCASPRRRSSGRSCARCRSTPRRRPIAIANDVEFGLAAGVWTNDLARAHRASRALQAGTVWVNTYGEVQMSVPYGGMKQSGHGRTLGEESIHELTQTKSVWMRIAR